MAKNQKTPKILEITKAEQYHTVDELFKRSQPDSIFYTLLILSSLIVACGLLLDVSAIVIGGMLLTPVLTPVLTIALGLSVGELESLKQISPLLLKSFLVILLSSAILGVIFWGSIATENISYIKNIEQDSMRNAILYFIVALASGMAATFGWARKEISEILPGIAIAVSLVPPLALIGIGLASLHFSLAQYYFLVFLFNFIGIVGGSLLVFSLLKFGKAEKKVEKEAKEIEKKAKEREEEKKKEKAEDSE